MTTSEWISLASSIGALGAATVAMFTLLELFRQRKSSYKPDLCIIKNNFYVRDSSFSDFKMPLDWRINQEEESRFELPSIELVNVGFGAAKEVLAAWEFKVELFLNRINKMAQENHETFYLQLGEHLVSLISNKGFEYHANARMNEFNFEYLLQAVHESRGRSLLLPATYTLMVSTYVGLCIKTEVGFENMNIPDLVLKLSYKDIGGGVHKSEHKLTSRVTMASRPHDLEKESPSFNVEVLENS